MDKVFLSQAQSLFKGDVCWDKCRSRQGRVYPLTGGTHIVFMCDQSFMNADAETLMRLSVPVTELIPTPTRG